MAHTLGNDNEHLNGLRINDLVAKIARVTLKDTTRVMLATILVAEFLDIDVAVMLREEEYVVDKPDFAQAGKCNQAFDELMTALRKYGDSRAVEEIRALD